ncbi:hypothetical protein [Aeromonas veronii]|uniref:Uncharacterized protein n=1 Tax=Aeromonas veronii TaxID=654 RepID=A0A2T4MWQ6_AERVE|nr:hypothetical protein [Aeromonas veronii]PTH78994.1 hypothetical protein DAA48_21385 [Aeromonas veronii]
MAWLLVIDGACLAVKGKGESASSLASKPKMQEIAAKATAAGLKMSCTMDFERGKIDVVLGRDLYPKWCLYPGETAKIQHGDIGKYAEDMKPLLQELKEYLEVNFDLIDCQKGVFVNASE